MTRWYPRTLKGRALAALFAVFTLSQLTGLLIFEHNRDRAIVLTEATDLAERISGIVNLTRGFPDENRRQILTAAETLSLDVQPLASIEEAACEANDVSRRMSQRFARAFHTLPGFSVRVCASRPGQSRFLPAIDGGSDFDVHVAVKFPDGEDAAFHTILPGGSSLLTQTVAVYLLPGIAAALLLGWLLMKWCVRPLERLARAADALGTDIDTTPMAEEGPREVSRTARAFNHMQSRLARRLHGQTEMLAAVSHDLRSAVTRLQLRAELLTASEEKEGLLRTVTHVRTMVQSVFDFVRGHNSGEPLRKVDIAALVESLCEDLIHEGFAITCHCDRPVILNCRPTDLRRGILNLIDNAVTHGGAAEVRLKSVQGCLLITVEDAGPGLPEEELEKVLQPFYRPTQPREDKSAGMGLGLAITANILHDLRGSVRLANRPTGGLRVEMRIPLNAPGGLPDDGRLT